MVLARLTGSQSVEEGGGNKTIISVEEGSAQDSLLLVNKAHDFQTTESTSK